MAYHNDLGQLGEEYTKGYLERKGYQIVDVNWKYKHLEIDVIAIDRDELVFIEVKTRSDNTFGNPELFVTKEKRRNVKKAARAYLESGDFQGEVRFDIISILYQRKEVKEIKHFENIFF